jgi:hypothetical protein
MAVLSCHVSLGTLPPKIRDGQEKLNKIQGKAKLI